jgi:hypothetical protein
MFIQSIVSVCTPCMPLYVHVPFRQFKYITFLQDLRFSVQCEQPRLRGCDVCQAGSSQSFSVS